MAREVIGEVGVNNNGVQWMRTGNRTYLCTYYLGEGVELSKEFKDVSMRFINALTFEELKD
jgi:hypothetical protein